MVGQLPPEPSGNAYSSLPTTLHAPTELAPAGPADTKSKDLPARRSIQTDVQSGFTEEGMAADNCEEWCLSDSFVVGPRLSLLVL